MILRLLAIPALAIASLAAIPATNAEASPAVPTGKHAGGVRIGVGVGFPIGGHRTHVHQAGYWSYQQVPVTQPVTVQVQVPYQVAVQVPDRVIGNDVNGNPIWSYRTELQTQYRLETRTEYRTTYVMQQVWVPTGHVVHHSPRAYGTVGVGFRIR
jgi:hypothetical protein